MLFVTAKRLEENMVLAHPILNPGGAVLLGEGAMLTASRIRRIREMGIPFVYIEDQRFPDLGSNWIIREELYQKALGELKQLFDTSSSPSSNKVLLLAEMKEIHQVFRQILTDIFALPGNTISHFINSRSIQNNFFEHGVNVALLSLLIGKKMNLAYMQMYNLGLGALLHDLGKAVLPQEILDPTKRLSPEEEELCRMHPRTGWELLQGQEFIWPTARIIALQHHECWNGSGFPSGLSGHNIHLFSHIVALANAYDNMTTFGAPGEKPLLPSEAFDAILRNQGVLYDPQVAALFPQVVAKYPLGTWVRLSTGHIGAVTSLEENGESPLVRCLFHLNFGTLKSPLDINTGRDAVSIAEVYRDPPEYVHLSHNQEHFPSGNASATESE